MTDFPSFLYMSLCEIIFEDVHYFILNYCYKNNDAINYNDFHNDPN